MLLPAGEVKRLVACIHAYMNLRCVTIEDSGDQAQVTVFRGIEYLRTHV